MTSHRSALSFFVHIHSSRIRRTVVLILAVLFSDVIIATPVAAQTAVDGFAPDPNSQVFAMAIQADGKILVGGQFGQIAAQPRANLARLDVDGTLDTTFDPAPDSWVDSLLAQPDGKILVGGHFTNIAGQPRSHLARLNADGTLDAAFTAEADDAVTTLFRQPDGAIVLAGDFSTVAGTARPFLARLLPDGSVDPDFDPQPNGVVTGVVVLPNGDIIIVGDFSQIGGQTHYRLARLRADGAVVPTFDPVTDNVVSGIVRLPDGNMVIAGSFTQIDGELRSGLARFAADGSLDMGFNPNVTGSVLALALQPDGDIVIAGNFTDVGGQPRQNIARVRPDGSLDAGFDPGADWASRVLLVQGDGKILAGGGFNTLGGQTRHNLGRLYPNGSLDDTIALSANSTVTTIAVQADDAIVIGGAFDDVGGTTRNRVARVRPDGTLDPGFDPAASWEARAVAVDSDGTMLIGGQFEGFAAVRAPGLGRVYADGAVEPTFIPEMNDAVNAVIVQPDGRILIGGAFTSANFEPRKHLARLNADGSLDTGFDPGVGPDGEVKTLALQRDGRVLIGGAFTTVNGQAHIGIARLEADGSLDSGFTASANGSVHGIALLPDGRMLVGGDFTSIGGSSRPGLARLEADGTVDSHFNPAVNGAVYALAPLRDGSVLIGGAFIEVNGEPLANVARIMANGLLDPDFVPDANDQVRSLAVQSDGKVLVGGMFMSIAGQSRARFARLAVAEAAMSRIDLSAGHTTIDWLWSGFAPAIDRVSFESSTDRVTWTPLTAPQWTVDHWSLSGVVLPRNQTFWLRAKGAVGGNASGQSRSLIESVRQFFLATYTVTPAAGGGGALAAVGSQTVDEGDTSAFSVTPDSGYHLDTIGGCGGTLVGTTFTTAPIFADCTVTATFAIDTYTVTATAGAHGAITPVGAQTVNHGDTRAFTVTPDPHYHIVTVNGCGGTLIDTTFTTAAITADCTVTATFAIDTYTVTATAGAHGAITPVGAQAVNHGDTRAFSVTPDAGYHVDEVAGCGGALVETMFTTAAITADCAVTASFAQDDDEEPTPTTYTRYFAEGAANSFFATRIAVMNPSQTAASVTLRLLGANGQETMLTRALPALQRTTFVLDASANLPDAVFSTVIESDQPIVADRLMTWDATGYGSSLETAVDAPGKTWYLAEGATGGAFSLYYLLQNPGETKATVEVTYLRPSPFPPIVKSYTVDGHRRFTIDVTGEDPGLAAAEVSAKITSDQPIVVERAMYRSTPGQPLAAGHDGVGIAAPQTRWFVTEGATGFFDEYVLIANAESTDAEVTATYLLDGAAPFTETLTVKANSRRTIDLKEHPELAQATVSVVIESTNDVPVVVERVMWWPHADWREASLSAGVSSTGTKWAFAEGEQGGPFRSQTYIAIANVDTTHDGTATVTLLYEDGTSESRPVTLPKQSRTTVDAGVFSNAANKRFGAIIESNGVPIVVERALYASPGGVTWAAGATSVATRITPQQ